MGCSSISSPGAFGWTPWVDRDAGYYAILGMQLSSGDATGGVVAFSVDLEHRSSARRSATERGVQGGMGGPCICRGPLSF
ncbi:hypothetical protein [Stigmatella aurantiaca]|uniref:Beta-lactamase-like protein n=1 Tax=Stigmatella aurantiaca (strain DW4/3-1) TaxID=378806 RepID=Q08M74_STIAD|nr:hypothetical protein [Stigmatella aurantiaca]ADO71673.1 Beta-lactamase-like protein [Stigmatella aurantiaca DW4/3-1]EAU61582.1 hypothetical protein STIAU_2523 [Stigmatella aurantiaca DW4/3-1]